MKNKHSKSEIKSEIKLSLNLKNLEDLSKDELIQVVLDLGQKYNDQIDTISEQNDKIEEILGKLKQNSNNTSRPPSTDSIGDKLDNSQKRKDRRKHKNRHKSSRKTGGQLGHKGFTLIKQTSDKVTKIIQIRKYDPNRLEGEILQTCQEIDIKVSKEVIEYQLISTRVKNATTTTAKLPFKNIIYSSNLKAKIAYFSTEHAISDDRIIRLFMDLYGISISGGTITNVLFKAKELLQQTNNNILKAIQTSLILGSDETFLSLNGNLAFLWNWQNPSYSYFKASENRKYENITDTIPDYKGVLITDRYAAHLKLDSKHQLCLVHLQRNTKSLPNSKFKTELLEILGKSQKAKPTQANYIYYRQRLKSLLTNLPPNLDKQSQKLARSLLKNQDHIFEFLLDPQIPHHNNATERELRKSKIKLKIAGCFRTLKGFQVYASILTFIQTCRKQGLNILLQLQKVFNLETPDLVWD